MPPKKDVEMKDAPKEEKKDDKMEVEEEPVDPVVAKAEGLKAAIAKNVSVIKKAVEGSQSRLMMRAIRNTTHVRKTAEAVHVARALRAHVPGEGPGGALRDLAIEAVGAPPEEPEAETPSEPKEDAPEDTPEEALPEVEIYLVMLAVAVLARDKKWEASGKLAEAALPRLKQVSGIRRSLDPLAAKIYFYYALCNEKLGRFEAVKPVLLAGHRTAVLKHDETVAAVCLNAVLRGLLQANLVEAALKLVAKTRFPEDCSNAQFCRYLYYTGRIQALQLDYTDAFTKLMQAQRKAPAHTAVGFRVEVQTLTVLVQLLMGEVPDRSAFEGKAFEAPLAPYLRLARCVRRGDLPGYHAVVSECAAAFERDRTRTLVTRLSQNVIKTGLRRINVSYSRISLEDVRAKLHLDSAKSAEFVCAKAIKDGVIDAVVDHDAACIVSREVAEVYNTVEPQKAFHRRIVFCLDVHNEALKAMQYPPDAHKPKKAELEGLEAEEDKEEKQTDEEIAKEIEEELGEDL